MIYALWHRFAHGGSALWLLLIAGVIVLDAFVGSWLIAQEIRLMREMLP